MDVNLQTAGISLFTGRVTVLDSAGKVVATASSTLLVFPIPGVTPIPE